MPGETEKHWRELWDRLGAEGDPLPAYHDLVRRYSEPHRAYHTLDHIRHCLEEFEFVRELAATAEAIEWAIWYHDAIYDTHAHQNEERSSELAQEVTTRNSLPAEITNRAVRHILASRHREPPVDSDTQLFVDVDLAILGQPWARFLAYENEIRREYEWVPAWLFRRKRRSILKAYLARPYIYCAPFFREKYETRARENIEKSLETPMLA